MGIMTTTDSVVTENIYKLKREPTEAARQIDSLDLTIRPVAANKHEVAGEVFSSVELAGEYVRKVRAIARKLKNEASTQQPQP